MALVLSGSGVFLDAVWGLSSQSFVLEEILVAFVLACASLAAIQGIGVPGLSGHSSWVSSDADMLYLS